MDGYDLQQAVRPFVQFIDDLTNWYIRRCRRRFWKSEDDDDKRRAYETLYEVLLRLCQIAAPFTPFISEAIYRNLRTPDMPESVHLCDYPLPGALARDDALEAQMAEVQQVGRPRPPAPRRLQPQGAPAAGRPARRLPRRGDPRPGSARCRTSSPTNSTSRKSASGATKPRWPNSPPRPTTRPSVPSLAAG